MRGIARETDEQRETERQRDKGREEKEKEKEKEGIREKGVKAEKWCCSRLLWMGFSLIKYRDEGERDPPLLIMILAVSLRVHT